MYYNTKSRRNKSTLYRTFSQWLTAVVYPYIVQKRTFYSRKYACIRRRPVPDHDDNRFRFVYSKQVNRIIYSNNCRCRVDFTLLKFWNQKNENNVFDYDTMCIYCSRNEIFTHFQIFEYTTRRVIFRIHTIVKSIFIEFRSFLDRVQVYNVRSSARGLVRGKINSDRTNEPKALARTLRLVGSIGSLQNKKK